MKKILVIEDEKEIRDKILIILKHEGYETIFAENGKLGVNVAHKENPDLILCDIMMPEMNGLEVYSEINHISNHEIIPFIFLSAKSDKSDIRKAMHLGAADYITKPFEINDLLDTLKTQLSKKEEIEQQIQDERLRLLAKLEDEMLAKDLEIERLKNFNRDQVLTQVRTVEKKPLPLTQSILLIVPSRLLRLRFTTAIKRTFDCNIIETDTIQDALKEIDDKYMDYIIIESNPPSSDPFLILRQIRCKPNLMNSPILIVAENIDKDALKDFAKFGKVDFILNPFNPETLKNKLAKYVAILIN
jgi:DNA-binding response OmpR family regulator